MSRSDPSQRPSRDHVTVHDRKRVLDDFFRIEQFDVSYPRYRRGSVERTKILVFERGDGAAAIVHNTDTDTVLLAEQFRFATFERGPGWLIEAAAGMIESGETSEDTIRREVHEELGYRVDKLEPIAHFYTSPGGSSERIYLYYAAVSSAAATGTETLRLGQENEDVRLVEMPVSEFLQHSREGAFEDAKTIIAAQWFELRLLRSRSV